jgi:predicted proteasome-type protease
VGIPKDKCLLESKCLKMGIPVKERQEDSYYYNQLKDFYEKKIVEVVKEFYKE